MDKLALNRLMEAQEFPCISILLPTYRTAPDYHKNGMVLKKLVREAENRLESELSKREAKPYIEKLNELAEKVDISKTLDGLALFVNSNNAEIIDLPFPVKERVVIDKTFATRDIIMTINRGIRYYALVLSIEKIRLIQCYRDEAVEIEKHGFPMYSNLDFYELNPSDLSQEKARIVKDFFRKASRALQDLLKKENQSIVVMGVEKNLGFFREVANLEDSIINYIEGSYVGVSAHDIGKKVWPAVKETMMKKRNESVSELEKAVSSGKYAGYLENVWRFANEGRVSLLLVEESYHQSCRLNQDNTITPLDEPEKGMIDDAVDEVAEIVLNKGGKVVFVNDGLLKDFNRIAAVLRY